MIANEAPKPDFFVLGAPKCGTTAMAHYLAGHPEIHFCEPKEPFFWADDLPGIRQRFGVSSLDAYLKFFENRREQHRLSGEGSTINLFSATAVGRILEFQPDAKFIVMLRQPVDLAYAFHMQQLLTYNESEKSFESAWGLQESRQLGEHLPTQCYEPKLLQYRSVANLGQQIDRLFRDVPRERVLAVFFEDFCKSPGICYRQILDFLGLADDGRKEFPRINEASEPRMEWLHRMLISRQGMEWARAMKRRLKGPLFALAVHTKTLLTARKRKRIPLSLVFRKQLMEEFADDIRLLADRTGRDLSHWCGS